MGDEQSTSEPLAKTRARRSNAGARMHEMIFNAEADPEFAQAFGDLLKPDDDSSDDEEYIPKDLDKDDIVKPEEDGDDEDHESNSESGSGSSCTDDSEDEDDDDEDENDDSGDEEEDRGNECEEKGDITPSRIHNTNRPDSKEFSKNSPSAKNVQQLDRKSDLQPGSPSKSAYLSCLKICSVCLGDESREDDEIIQCDLCGVSVHETCYGVSNSDSNTDNESYSVHSNLSSESTEPWFCDPCKRSVKNPFCELCPNTGGIFKETDTGRWVHIVCALYIRGVTFEDIDNLSQISLFELNYNLYGSKACTICEDRRLARSGICIGCDAGLCKTFFHATCAQKEGLLFESHSDEVDPYFAQCKQHADKTIIRRKKKLCTAMFASLRRFESNETKGDRIKDKLAELTKGPDQNLSKYHPSNMPPIPHKVSRLLLTSPSVILKLTKKSELMGLDPKSAAMNITDEMETARQKWHITPNFNLEFVAYCLDRTSRMVRMKKRQTELVSENLKLKEEESRLRDRYNDMKSVVQGLKLEIKEFMDDLDPIIRCVKGSPNCMSKRILDLTAQTEKEFARCISIMNGKQTTTTTAKTSNGHETTKKANSTYKCGKCNTVEDQHLLALCDTCHSYIHIYCLDPPLARVPKKTKFGGWQCSDCFEKDEEEQEEAIEEQNLIAIKEINNPRRLRDRIKYPEKYCDESLMVADFWSTNRKRPKKSSTSKGKSNNTNNAKKVKTE